jgi:ParB family transcriptional regulator, chromosome partitioning protein
MMSDKKPGLGRGLSALLEEIGGPPKPPAAPAPMSADPAWTYLPIAHIYANPDQPRRHFQPEALEELTESIRRHGVLQPVIVRPRGLNRFELIAGERRWRAAQATPLHEIPAIIRRFDNRDAHTVALIENIQRADLNAIEEAQAYQHLMREFDYDQTSVAKLTGKSRSHVANMVRLLALPPEVADLLRDGKLSMGHARALIGRNDAVALAEQVVARGLSVRETEALVAPPADTSGAVRPAARATRSPRRDPDTEALERALSESVGLKVAIAGNGQSGRVVIDYATLDQLDMLAQRLSGGRF